MAVATLRLLRQRIPEAQLLLAGHGELAGALPQDEPGLQLLGQQAPGSILAQAHLLLMTSRNEGLPLAAIEAAHAGRPVIAPAVGGLVDLHRQGIVHATRRTAADLASAIADCWERGWQKQGTIAQAQASRYLPIAFYRAMPNGISL